MSRPESSPDSDEDRSNSGLGTGRVDHSLDVEGPAGIGWVEFEGSWAREGGTKDQALEGEVYKSRRDAGVGAAILVIHPVFADEIQVRGVWEVVSCQAAEAKASSLHAALRLGQGVCLPVFGLVLPSPKRNSSIDNVQPRARNPLICMVAMNS